LISLSAFIGNNNQREEEHGVDSHGQVDGEDVNSIVFLQICRVLQWFLLQVPEHTEFGVCQSWRKRSLPKR
jgi:hypothetical protein